MTNFNVEIVSDTVCPWCYVGHKQLSKAIATYRAAHPDSNDTFSTTWKPFYLDPDAPKVGIEKSQRFAAKFGPERTQAIFQRLGQVGQAVGISFKFGGKTGNTRDSHRLIQLGKTKGPDMQTKVVEALFTSYFENEGDITSKDVLLSAAKKAGLDEAEAKQWLESDDGGKQVDEEVREAQERMISGVPHFTLNERFEVQGAQDSSAFVRLFERLKKIEGDEEGKIEVGSKC
jgi:predicted DsbA family dithiol-disulfide isomerase